jgi:hypothetical protein
MSLTERQAETKQRIAKQRRVRLCSICHQRITGRNPRKRSCSPQHARMACYWRNKGK